MAAVAEMTPWDHVQEAERLAGKAEADAAYAPDCSIAWAHLALVHIELAKAKDMLAGPPTVAAMDQALSKARSIGRVYPLDAP